MLPDPNLTLALDGAELFDLTSRYLPAHEMLLLRNAFALAKQEHGDQLRKSGEPFYTHPLTVAYYLAHFHLDSAVLVAALLHDVAEDTKVSVEEITRKFGPGVGQLVDGVTKLDALENGRLLSPDEKQSHTLHKLFEAMIRDVRVILIKLFDRLHNIRTIQFMPHHKQLRTAEETLSVYAPLANRLGMWELKTELEWRSFQVINPLAFDLIEAKLEESIQQQQSVFAQVSQEIASCLAQHNIPFHKIELSPRNVYTEFQSCCQEYDDELELSRLEVDRTLRLVVLLENVPACYLALGHIHQLWRPIQRTFDDYIAAPRDNLYRALHTTVMHDNGQHIKIRLRTVEMNITAAIGVLSRWLYAQEPPIWGPAADKRVEALSINVSDNINLEPQNPAIGVQGVVQDVFSNQIVVYTPQGDAHELPQGSTAIDFAYAIHTAIGHQTRVAYVNGVGTPLNKPLNDGDRVYIGKRGRSAPARTWLDEDLGYLQTSRAKSHVRRWFRRLAPEVAIQEGERLLSFELTMVGLSTYPHQWIADLFGYDNPDDLYHALGRAEILPTNVATKLLAVEWDRGQHRSVGMVVESSGGEKFVVTHTGNRPVRLCQTCAPRPPTAIVGYIRKDGGVTVHRENCHNLPPDPISDRTIKLGWGSEANRAVRLIRIQIDGYDRAGLMFEVLQLIQDERLNMSSVEARTGENQAHIWLDLEVTSPRQLVRILHRALALVNVYLVHCTTDEAITRKQPLVAHSTRPYYKPE